MSGNAANKIAYQGVAGANSHMACQVVFPEMEPVACQSFEDAFAAVSDRATEIAMIPIENSLGGRVADIHHLLPESGLYIVGEHFHAIRYQLLAPAGASLESLKTVYSHPQGLAQCRGLIRDLGLTPVTHADTAGAAKDVAERGDPTEAAIAPALAGEIYGLQSLRNRIEDRLGNTTRFVIMARQRSDPSPDTPSIVSLVFQVRSVPAALYKALGGFATNGINVVKLESYITDSAFTVAQFYAEVEGHVALREVDRALEELQYFSSMMKVLGVYPAHAFRADR
jgi:prephenate dehydratase